MSSQSISRFISVYPGMQEYSISLQVTFTDPYDGTQRVDTRTVIVRDPAGCPTCY